MSNGRQKEMTEQKIKVLERLKNKDKVEKIMSDYGMTVREMQKMFSDMRELGIPVCALKRRAEFVSYEIEDIEDTMRYLVEEIHRLQKDISSMRDIRLSIIDNKNKEH